MSGKSCSVLTLLVVLFVTTSARADESSQNPPERSYQMDHYVMVLLYRSANAPKLSDRESNEIQQGHMANIQHMAKIGKLLLAGPFEDDTSLRGLFLFKPGISIDEVKNLVDADPAVKAGRLRYEIHPWFSAKGIQIVQ